MNAVLLAELKDRKHFTESRSKIVQSSGTNKKRKNPSAKKKKQTTRYFPRSESRFAGIQNQGSTCFLNSLLQMFYAIPEFRIALYSWHRDLKKDGNDEDCAGYQMQRFFAALERSKRGALSTRSLTGSFGWNMRRIGQQDCQECMAAILDFFITQYDGTTLERHARRWQGRELAYVKCLETNSIRPCGKEQPFWALRLQVENCSSIVDAFSALLKPEIMKGDNAIMNETLGRKTDSERGTILSQLPEFLTIQLQRFTFDLKTLRQIKLNNVIKFPFVLNLTDVMSSAVATQMATSTSDKTKYIYDLHAVVIHLGSVTSGHYFAYALHKKESSQQWYVFNDVSVTEMSEENIRTAFGKDFKSPSSSKSEEKKTLRDALSAAREGLNVKKNKKSTRKVVVNAYKYAYVLLYRCRDQDASSESKKNTTLIPKDILESIERDNEKYVEAKQKYEYERNMIRFRIHCENRSVVSNLRMHNSKSVKFLKKNILNQEKIENADMNNTRLRIYDQIKNLRRRPLQDDEILSDFLDRDSIVHLWVETKRGVKNSSFENWIENGIVVKVFRLLDDRDEYEENMRQCVVARSGTVKTLRKTCAELLNILEPIIIVNCRGTKANILSDDTACLTRVLRDGDEIRVEISKDKNSPSRVMKIFDAVTNRITLKLYVRGEEVEDAKEEKARFQEIEIDRRAKLIELRRVVGKKLEKNPDTFQLRREVRGPELKNNEKNLASYLFRDDGRVFVDLGKRPTEMGSFSILVSVLRKNKKSNPFLENVRKVEGSTFLEVVNKEEKNKKQSSETKKKKEDQGGKNKIKCTRDSTCRCEMCLSSAMVLPASPSVTTSTNVMNKKLKSSDEVSMMTTQLGKLTVRSNMSNEELKRAIFDKFESGKLLPSSIERIRLRGQDNSKKRLTKVYFDNRTLIKNNPKIRDGTEIVVQPCQSKDCVTEKSLLIVVRRFRENDLILEPECEISIDKTATIDDLSNKLKSMSGLSDIVMAKPFPYQLLSLKTLCSKIKWGHLGGGCSYKNNNKNDTELGTRKGLMWRDGTIVLFKEKMEKRRKLMEVKKWNKRVGDGDFVAVSRDEISDMLTWLGKRNEIAKSEIETTSMKPWEFRARKFSNRKWICGNVSDDVWNDDDSEIMLVWRKVGECDDEKMMRDNVVISVMNVGGRREQGIKIYTPAEIADMRRKKQMGG